jgi:hypothetical protein
VSEQAALHRTCTLFGVMCAFVRDTVGRAPHAIADYRLHTHTPIPTPTPVPTPTRPRPHAPSPSPSPSHPHSQAHSRKHSHHPLIRPLARDHQSSHRSVLTYALEEMTCQPDITRTIVRCNLDPPTDVITRVLPSIVGFALVVPPTDVITRVLPSVVGVTLVVFCMSYLFLCLFSCLGAALGVSLTSARASYRTVSHHFPTA